MGLGEEMMSQYATLEFKPYENEILIGFHPSNEAILGFISPFLINPSFLKGDGSQDLHVESKAELAASWHDMLTDDKSVIEHLLKGISYTFKTRLYEGSREILLNTIQNKWNVFQPFFEAHPYLSVLFLYNKAQGKLDFACDDELRTQIMEFINENVPPAAMGLKDALQFVKSSGMVPFEMLEPFIQWFSTNFANEVRIYI